MVSAHGTVKCQASLGNTGDPVSKTQRKSTAKNSKATWRGHTQDVAILKNISGLGPARSTLATVAVDPFFLTKLLDYRAPRPDDLSTGLQYAAVPCR